MTKQNEQGYWELVSPLPDCPVGTKGILRNMSNNAQWWEFLSPEIPEFATRRTCHRHSTYVMERNPDIFRWVPEPEQESPARCENCRSAIVNLTVMPDGKILCDDCKKPKSAESTFHCDGCDRTFAFTGTFTHVRYPVPEPVKVWPQAATVQISFGNVGETFGKWYLTIPCASEREARRSLDLIHAALQALGDGEAICSMHEFTTKHGEIEYYKTIARPDGSKP